VRTKFFFPATVLAAFVGSSVGHAANWPAWRGPAGDGITTETELPLTWSATENVGWKTELPERGNSTPIVWGDRVFVTQAEGSRRTILCFHRRDGKVLWQQGPEWKTPERSHATNPPCSASPVTDGERVIAWFGSAGVWCFDNAGQQLWHVDLGVQDHEWGYGSSPMLHGDLCILNFGPGPRSFLVALDKKTGKEAWRFDVPSPETMEGPGAAQKYLGSWSTPILVSSGGRKELVAALPGALWSFDPTNGKPFWHCNGLNTLTYADPLPAGNVVVAMGGFGGYAMGVKLGGMGDVTATHRLWLEKRSAQRIGSGVVKDGRIFMINEPGTVQCIEPDTGKILWQERLKPETGNSSSWSSLLLSGDRIYAVTQRSDTIVFRAGASFEQLAVNSLNDGLTNASPAVSDGDIFLRTHKHLWCIRARR
jgi:outer membrane protein assembly factor BamB